MKKDFFDNDFFKNPFFSASTFKGRAEGKAFIPKPKRKPRKKKQPIKD